MKTYLVEVKEIWINTVRVEAENEEEAKQLVCETEGETVSCDYSHTDEVISIKEEK